MDRMKIRIGMICRNYPFAVFLGFAMCTLLMSVVNYLNNRKHGTTAQTETSVNKESEEDRPVLIPCNRSCIYEMHPFYSTACSCSNVTISEKNFSKRTMRLLDRKCHPREHVFYLKTFKTASSTVVNIMYRFALERNLKVLLFNHWHVLRKELLLNHTMDYAVGKFKSGSIHKYDMLMDHVIYDRKFLLQFMHSDTQFVTSVRHPWTRLNSHLNFFTRIFKGSENTFNLDKNKRIPLNVQFVQNLEKYGRSYEKKLSSEMAIFSLRNQLSKQLGVSPGLPLDHFLHRIKQDFRIIILQEYFDESLLLLKRKFCWSMADILYTRLRQKKCTNDANCRLGADKRYQRYERQFRQWSSADYLLYNAINSSFWNLIRQEKNFYTELMYFRHINIEVNKWCKKELFDFIEQNPHKLSQMLEFVDEDVLVISETEYNRKIVFDRLRCLLMRIDGNVWRNLFRFRQFPELCNELDRSRVYSPKTFDYIPNDSLWANHKFCGDKSSCCNIPLDVLKNKDSFM